ncbi:MAG TPA: hypothetical protein VFK35_00365 [Candidatus Limnocylindrales bacterium]|nr:hypothetical protein [Candidatus Limnocylindrales bacterium]
MHPSRRRRLAIGVIGALALSGAAVAPAAAVAPVVEARHVEVTRDIPGFIDCGDDALDYHVDVVRTITEFHDPDGSLDRVIFDIHYKGTVTNSVSGLVARDDGSRMFIDDYDAETTTLVRGSHHVTVPGWGIVFGETGRIVWDWNGTPIEENEDDDIEIFRSGLHGDPVEICDAMR